jgi:Rrf2 family protein
MDMSLSKRGDYVMRSAICLARAFDAGEGRKIREVVAETEIPATFASQILADLVRAGLATSRAGRRGGYRLAREPGRISALEVVEAAEGPLRAERCALGDGPCRWDAVCPLHETWTGATGRVRELLAETTLAELAARDRAIEAGTYEVPPDSHRMAPLARSVADFVQVELGEQELLRALRGAGSRLDALAEHAVGGAGAGTPHLAPHAMLAPAARGRGALESRRLELAVDLPGLDGGARLEAGLEVRAVDADRSELVLDGVWHHRRAEGATAKPRDEEVDLEARQVVRRFLRLLARLAEDSAAGAPDPRGRAAGNVLPHN